MSLTLSSLGTSKGKIKRRKRVGRGPGSGKGSQSGRGHKGQKARSGYKVKFWFEGGQMPLSRRLPKRGFTNVFRREYQVVNLADLARIDEPVIDREVLLKRGLLRNRRMPFKILGDGEVTRALQVKADAISASAREKILKAGGTVEVGR